jgi:molybdopterin converting factor small subunit
LTVILVRYFAAARAAAGVSEEKLDAPTLAQLLDALVARHGPPLASVLGRCSFLIDGLVCHDRNTPLAADTVVDVLPPFAGG